MQFVGACGEADPPEVRLAAVRGLEGAVQLLDARHVFGRDHPVSTAEHAQRAMRAGTNVAKSLAVEFVLCASGERQIADALRMMGIRDDTREFAVVLFGDANPGELRIPLRNMSPTRTSPELGTMAIGGVVEGSALKIGEASAAPKIGGTGVAPAPMTVLASSGQAIRAAAAGRP